MGAYLTQPVTDKVSEDKAFKGMTYGASSMQGWRITQEDAHNCLTDFDESSDTSLFAVYDGHGGSEVAQYCALYLPKFIKNLSEYEKGDLAECFKAAFLKFDATLVDEEVIKELKVLAGDDDGGDEDESLMRGKQLIVANAGDSRCVLSRDGQCVELSFDHKPEDEIEKNRIEKAGGKVTADGRVNGGLNLSRALGDHWYKRNADLPAEEQMISACPDLQTVNIEDNDEFIVLACDGIWNYLSSQEVVDYVRERLKYEEKRQKPSLICEEVCNVQILMFNVFHWFR
ncbi:hypothetical protein LOTGIDRAFT_180731 [Lottia gigantea]|uniref:protein-serine/threonine phosphatase n=1 Tax=Lottia gigantea TaxID=225164 RepID=V4A5V2_LOTGI|nr:hypothetical protein LOTGIDRAFT_180731 [Lottia gigantea]ESO92097.1 hypothetical protein LOTGIDRAFT_180731 [Lottia gigantea]